MAVTVCITPFNYAQSAEWYWLPEVKLSTEYNDNPGYRSSNRRSARADRVNAEVTAGVRQPSREVSVSAGYRDTRYNKKVTDSDERDIKLSSDGFQRFQRHQLGLSVEYKKEASIRSRIEDLGVDRGDIDKESFVYSPNWSYQLSDTSTIQVALSKLKVEYDTADNSYSDYENKYWQISYQKQVSQRLALFTEVSNSDLSFRGIVSDSSTHSVSIGGIWDATERWKVDASVGYRKTDSKYETLVPLSPILAARVVQNEDSTGKLFSMGATHKMFSGEFGINLQREVTPSGRGVLNKRDGVNLSYLYRHSPKLSSSVKYKYFSTEPVQENKSSISSRDRKFHSLSASVFWKLSRNLSLTGGVSFRQLEYSNSALDKADSTRFSVGLIYKGTRRSTSY